MITVACRRCGSTDLQKNGHTPTGRQKIHCKACHFHSTIDLQTDERAKKMADVERLHHERVSQRGIARVTGVSRSTIIKWLKKVTSAINTPIIPSKERPILEFDELWSFVHHKKQKIWIWLAYERQTKKIVGIAFGDRSAETGRALWQSLPADYRKRAIIYTDEYKSYPCFLPKKRHRPCKKGLGQTNHIERFNNTIRQRCANLVRKTLSFSKNVLLHEIRVRMVIEHLNQALSV